MTTQPPVRRGPTRRQRKKKADVEQRRSKVFLFRGKTIEELKALSVGELLPLLSSRARRTLRRGLEPVQEAFLARLRKTPEDTVLRTHLRDLPILPEFVGRSIAVHAGKEFKTVEIEPDMIGHYLGEFALTRKEVKHTGPGVGATRSSKFMPLK